jgi:chemotaxis protein CheY-P-specific phosphatase CheC
MQLDEAQEIINLFLENEIDQLERVLGDDHPYSLPTGNDIQIKDIRQAFSLLTSNEIL